jgi:hypothetical protein
MLPSQIKTQQAILLGKLPGWNESQLEKKLHSLEIKGIVVVTNNGSVDRRIALERLSTIPSLDAKEKTLWLLLRSFVSQIGSIAFGAIHLF